MHELSIATSILDSVEKIADEHRGTRLEKVGLRIGDLAGIDIDALTFGWEALTKDTEWESVVLEIERVPRKNRCDGCRCVFEVHNVAELTCPRCGAFPTFNVSGDELEIAYVEIEEVEEAKS